MKEFVDVASYRSMSGRRRRRRRLRIITFLVVFVTVTYGHYSVIDAVNVLLRGRDMLVVMRVFVHCDEEHPEFGDTRMDVFLTTPFFS